MNNYNNIIPSALYQVSSLYSGGTRPGIRPTQFFFTNVGILVKSHFGTLILVLGPACFRNVQFLPAFHIQPSSKYNFMFLFLRYFLLYLLLFYQNYFLLLNVTFIILKLKKMLNHNLFWKNTHSVHLTKFKARALSRN